MSLPLGVPSIAIDFIAAFFIGLAATAMSLIFVRRFARVDTGGGRRTHQQATPRAGGLGVAIALSLLLYQLGGPYSALWLIPGMAALGLLDDFFPQPAALRLLLQFALALAAVLQVEKGLNNPLGNVLVMRVMLATMVVGFVNLANFFDGRNGLLAGNFAIIVLALPLLGINPVLTCVLGALWLGFLPFNFPRAKVFMGDVGSYCIGACLGWLFLQAVQHSFSLGMLFLIACSGILADPILTLIQRALAGKTIWRAHREHLYQWAARVGWSDTKLFMATVIYSTAGIGFAVLILRLDVPGIWQGALIWIALSAMLWFYLRRRVLRNRRQNSARNTFTEQIPRA